MKKYIFLAVLLVIVGGLFVAIASYEKIVKNVVHKYGSQIVGTDVSLEGFDISFFKGEARVKKIVIANPKGYTTPHFISLDGVFVKIDMNSVLTDTIIIDSVVVDKPSLSYEIISLTQNNVKEIQDNITKNTATAKQVEEEETKKASEEGKKETSSKKVIIKNLQIKSGEIIAAVAGGDVTVPLPDVNMKNIGAAKKGNSVAEIISKFMNQILKIASRTIASGKFADLKNVAEENLNEFVGGVKDTLKNLGIFGN